MHFAIVGAGTIGAVHARLIGALADEGVRLTAVVNTNLERAKLITERYGGRPYTSAAEAYAHEEIDAVSVCVPSWLHSEVTVEALRAGKHVLVEKPVEISLEAADSIAEARRSAGRTVAVVSQRRFQPPAAFIKEAVTSGRLGRVTSGIAESPFFRPQSYYDSGGWRGTLACDGGGALMNQGIHALDLLIWMLGRPVTVTAQTGQVAHEGIEVEDVAAATIRFENGAIGVLLASTAAYPDRPIRLTVHGDRGTAVMADDRLAFFQSAEVADPNAAGLLPLPADPDRPGWSAVDHAQLAQYRDFVTAVRDGRSPAVPLEAGRLTLAVVLAVYESARTGHPVDLADRAEVRP
ncbi:Gfo/Idh/MocA family protein [Kitasatospora sp. NPDC052896]|uniref:Gfo/Idh/MocA family protein n=1 Tax=Kitasatospora sp. NPDC052896 TaxID=3364061 RepID=UPI0037CCBAFF